MSPKFIILIFIFSVAVRLYRIDTPPIDAHSWRQSITTAIAKNFITEDSNILRPRQNEILPEKNFGRYIFLEFPIYEYSISLLYRIFGMEYWIPRMISIVASAITAVFISFFITMLFSSKKAGLIGGLAFSLFPVSYFYGRSVIPDMMGLMFFSACLYLLIRNIQSYSIKYLIAAAACLSFAGIIKPYYFIYIPLFAVSLLSHTSYPRKAIKQMVQVLILCCFITFSPYVLWASYYRLKFPVAIPTDHMFGILGLTSIQYPQYLQYMLVERFSSVLFTPAGFLIICLGGVIYSFKTSTQTNNKYRLFLFIWGLLFLLYLLIVADGNFAHHYYQLPFIPLACILFTQTVLYICQVARRFIKRTHYFKLMVLCSILIVCVVLYGVQFVKIVSVWFTTEVPYFTEIPKAQQIIPINSRVIVTGLFRNPSFLDLSARHGWPINSEFIETNNCPPEYLNSYTEKQNDITDQKFQYVLYCYVYPFIQVKQQLGATYLVVLKKELPNSFTSFINSLDPNKPLYISNEMAIYDLNSFIVLSLPFQINATEDIL